MGLLNIYKLAHHQVNGTHHDQPTQKWSPITKQVFEKQNETPCQNAELLKSMAAVFFRDDAAT